MRQALNLVSVVGMFVVFASATTLARAEDFRIDTDIFIGSSKTPAAEILTLFHSGNVYDFQLSDPSAPPARASSTPAAAAGDVAEITVFEPRRGLLTLINPQKKQRASLTTIELLNAAVNLQAAVAEQKNPNPVFLAAAKPAFDVTSENIQENGGDFTKLIFASKTIHYTVTAQAARHAAAATDYRYFSDWSARLSSLRPGGGLPAGARLEVNDALARKGLIPTKVERVIHSVPRNSEVRSQHLIVWALSQEDAKRIERVGDLLINTDLVGFEKYCGLTPDNAAAKPVAVPQQQARK